VSCGADNRRRRQAGLILGVLLAGAPLAHAADVSEKMTPCLTCHGEQGQSQLDNVPSLGGQPAAYALIQLFLFRERLFVAEPMNDMTKGLTDDDLRAMSDAIAALPPPKPPTDEGDPGRLERARAISAQHRCNICHRPDFSGQDNVPRLADQREDYLLKSLRAYKSGARRGYDPIMVETLSEVPEAQLAELAYYLSHLR